jgi:branched-chain amino acid transport system permease protein
MKEALKIGLIGGVIEILLSLIGMVEAFAQRQIVSQVISMGHSLLLLTVIFMGYMAAQRGSPDKGVAPFARGLLAGLVTGALVFLLVLIGSVVRLRAVFVNASPALYELLSFKQSLPSAALLLVASGGVAGLLAALMFRSPPVFKRVLITALGSVLVAGVLQDLLRPTFAAWGPLAGISTWLFTANGLTLHGAVTLGLAVSLASWFWAFRGEAIRSHVAKLPPSQKKGLRFGSLALFVAVLLVLPQILGLFLSEVLTIVGLYVLLGLGLNIVVGFAGLLDLGYVAFFAIGAYVTALLTSPELGFFSFTFWEALPVAIAAGVIAGVLLGIPVLKMRGDYLAITTLGFGEIIRILVLSDFLRPWLGGAQGIGKIAHATIGRIEFVSPQQIYYLILAGCLLVVFISVRLRDSRLGRAWKAIREDEDVAQAMGINLVVTKLLAFATGAGFSALSGAIFASKLGSVYPHSFNVMISINILCVIIVGGMGSIPGAIVGSMALVGLPELLREFAEYRLFVYGAALVAMMLLRPEGLWPEAVRRRELREEVAEEGQPDLGNPSSGS